MRRPAHRHRDARHARRGGRARGDRRPGADRRRRGRRAARGAGLARAPPAARPPRRRHPRPRPGERPRRDAARPRRRGGRAAGDQDRAAPRRRRRCARAVAAIGDYDADLPDQPQRRAAALRGAARRRPRRPGARRRDASPRSGPGTAARAGRARHRRRRRPRALRRRGAGRGAGARSRSRAAGVLVARAADARDVLPDGSRERGAEVDVVALYETVREQPDAGGGRGRPGRRLRHLHLLLDRPQPDRGARRALPARRPRRLDRPGDQRGGARGRPRGRVEAERHDVDGLLEALLDDAGDVSSPSHGDKRRPARVRRAPPPLPRAPTRPTPAPASWPRPAPRTAPSSPPREQSAGRGRQGRTWTAPPGRALLYSAILRPLDERHLLLPLAVPLAVCEAAEALRPGIECTIKWPNDVWVEGRKLAGILIEARPQDGWAVIGVGLNLAIARDEFPPELRETATSLFGSARRGADGSPEPQRGCSATLPRPSCRSRSLSRQLDRWATIRGPVLGRVARARRAARPRDRPGTDGSGVADGVDDRGPTSSSPPAATASPSAPARSTSAV